LSGATTAESAGGGRPRVSVITPTYNYGALIGETLESLRRQTLEDWECVVVDDGSTDDTAEVVALEARRDPRVRYVRQANQRQAVAKNTGLARARGRYLQFLDADDLIERRKLELQVEYLESHADVDIVYGGARFFRTQSPGELLHSMGDDDRPWMPQVSGRGAEVLGALVRDNAVVINAPLVRRGVADRVGPFDPVLPPAEDWDYWLRCALAGARFEFADMPETLALVRAHPTSSSQDRFRMYTAGLRIREKLDASLEDGLLLALNRELRARDEADMALIESARGNSLGAARRLLKSARLERRWRWRAKLFACALAAPLVSESGLRSLTSSSLTGLLKGRGRGAA
jgi:glycosyltransferase involved in cell wall biosynthesis